MGMGNNKQYWRKKIVTHRDTPVGGEPTISRILDVRRATEPKVRTVREGPEPTMRYRYMVKQ